MGKSQVISGTEKKSYKPSEKDYALAFAKKIRVCSFEIESKDDIIKIVFLFIKASARLNLNGVTRQEIELRISSIQTIHGLISKLTPVEFIRAFPITKKYDGEKYLMRDYYSTVEALKKYPPDSEIGSDNVISFLMDYDNPDIVEFEVHKLSVISAWGRLSGQPGVMEEFMMEHGIPSYTYYETEGIMVERGTGKVIKVSKPKKRIPKWIRTINGGSANASQTE